jgi:hypothetical protein
MTVGLWDFVDLPTNLNNILFGGTTAGLLTSQLMLTAFLAMLFLIPSMMLKAKPDIQVVLVMFAILISTGLGWCPSIIMVCLIFIIGLAYAGVFRKMVVG